MGFDLDEFFKNKDEWEKLGVGECMEMSMNIADSGDKEEVTFLACRTDEKTVKMKMDVPGEDAGAEFVMRKREMKKGDFKK